jgi:hypothetical protein
VPPTPRERQELAAVEQRLLAAFSPPYTPADIRGGIDDAVAAFAEAPVRLLRHPDPDPGAEPDRAAADVLAD